MIRNDGKERADGPRPTLGALVDTSGGSNDGFVAAIELDTGDVQWATYLGGTDVFPIIPEQISAKAYDESEPGSRQDAASGGSMCALNAELLEDVKQLDAPMLERLEAALANGKVLQRHWDATLRPLNIARGGPRLARSVSKEGTKESNRDDVGSRHHLERVDWCRWIFVGNDRRPLMLLQRRRTNRVEVRTCLQCLLCVVPFHKKTSRSKNFSHV